MITRPALRYYGGKWKLAPWIMKHFPPHACYCEPYGGAASVLLQKPPSELEVYNDAGRWVTTFFRVLRERPDELVHAIRLTPYSRAEFVEARVWTDDPLELARRVYVLAQQGRGGLMIQRATGWRFMRSGGTRSLNVCDDWRNIEYLHAIADRLLQVQLECDDALAVIVRYDTPDTLFYVDPPYLLETRSNHWDRMVYEHELSETDHVQLAVRLHAVQGMVIVSGYPSPLYDQLYAGWERIETVASVNASSGTEQRTECLWLSPRVAARRLPMAALWEGERL
jgi:DNA adenine methylase